MGLKVAAARSLPGRWAALLAALGVLGVYVATYSFRDYQAVIVTEQERLSTQARVVRENLLWQLESTDTTLLKLRVEIARGDKSRAGLSNLELLVDAMPDIRTIAYTNAEGIIVGASRKELLGFNAANREYFRTARQQASKDMLFISPPYRTSLGAWVVNLTRVIMDGHGEFRGIVIATIDQAYMHTLIQSVRYAPDMWVAVVHGDGKPFVVTPEERLQGLDLDAPGTFFAQHRDSGRLESDFSGKAALTGEDSQAVFTTVRSASLSMDKPLVVAVGRPRVAIMRAWNRQVSMLGGAYVLTLVAAVVVMAAVQRYSRRQQHRIEEGDARLRQRDRDLRSILDHMPAMIGYWDKTQHNRFGNKAYHEWFGIDAGAMVGRHIREVIGDERYRLNQPYIEAALRGETQAFEREIPSPLDGSTRFALANYIPDVRDGAVEGFYALVTDVTPIKHAEARLQLAAGVFTHAREGILIADAHGTIVDVNASFTRITGYDRSEALGRNPRMLQSGRQGADFYAVLWQELTEKGYWSGEIWNRRKDGEVYAELLTISVVRDGTGKTQNYVALFSDITPMKEQQQQLERIAHFDPLTGLPNRLILADRLQQAMAQCQRRKLALAVVFIDLDGFKAVNDSYGHDVGDELLVVVSRRMLDCLREADTLARIGGDEFVAVLADLESPAAFEAVVCRLLTAVAEPVTVGAVVTAVSASIGVTVYPQDNVDGDQLMRHADQAMYQAKTSGKNRFRLHDVASVAAERRTSRGGANA